MERRDFLKLIGVTVALSAKPIGFEINSISTGASNLNITPMLTDYGRSVFLAVDFTHKGERVSAGVRMIAFNDNDRLYETITDSLNDFLFQYDRKVTSEEVKQKLLFLIKKET